MYTNKVGTIVVIVFFTLMGMYVGVSGYQEYQAYRLMQRNVAGLVQIANYNISAGVLKQQPPAGAPMPASTVPPTPVQ